MSEDIHGTFSADISDKLSWRDSPLFKTLEALRPWLQWLVIVVMFFGGMYLYQRDSNTQQVVNVGDLQRKQADLEKALSTEQATRIKEISDLRSIIVTKELFEERTGAIKTQVNTIDTRTIEILNRLPSRP